MVKTLQIPMQIRDASVAPATIDTEKRTVELVWSAGTDVTRTDGWTGETFIEKLSMEPSAIRLDRLNNGAPLLNTHARYDLSNVLGVVERAWVADGEGRAVVRFSGRDEVAKIWQDVAGGIHRNVSVGYLVHKFKDITEKGARVKTYLATDWEPHEISLVPVGADPKAGIRSQDSMSMCEISLPDEGERDEQNPDASSVSRDADTGDAAPPEDEEGKRRFRAAEALLALAPREI